MVGKKKTNEEYIQEVNIKNPNIEVVGAYINARTPIMHKCKIDNCEWLAMPTNILGGKGCPMCRGHKKKSHIQYVSEVNNINPDIEVVGQYINSQTLILHRCKIDGYEWLAIPNNILRGRGCPKCAGNIKITQEEYIKRVYKINPDIEVIGQYTNNNQPVLHRCRVDGNEWMAIPNNVLSGKGCPVCKKVLLSVANRKTHEEYVSEVAIINPTIEVIGQYNGTHMKILHKCLIDGAEWMATPHDILEGKGCPTCNMSCGENIVRNYLIQNKIKFSYNYTFDDCRNIKPLPFDFYLPEYNVCIEYDGEQHFKPIDVFGGAKEFYERISRDKIKTDYCMNHNITLLRIPYDQDVKLILDDYFINDKAIKEAI